MNIGKNLVINRFEVFDCGIVFFGLSFYGLKDIFTIKKSLLMKALLLLYLRLSVI